MLLFQILTLWESVGKALLFEGAARSREPASSSSSPCGPAETFGNADFFAEQKLLLIDLCRLGSDTLLDPVVLRAEDGTVDITLRMSAPTVGEVRGNGMLCLIPVPADCTGAEITLYPEGK